MQEERNDLKTELLIKSEAKLKYLEHFQHIRNENNERDYSGENTVGIWPKDPLTGRLVSHLCRSQELRPRNWKDDPKGNSEIIRASTAITGPE